ncbi:hypothetical protein LTR93_011170 [Exophiala xenobiotica]|nr:hypothetical protein LTR93_011170 [Exophiala xenobiotica]
MLFGHGQHTLKTITTTVVTDHEGLKWIDEFAQYRLDFRYREGSEAVVPDTISRRPDFMGDGPANRAWVEESDPTEAALAATQTALDEDLA